MHGGDVRHLPVLSVSEDTGDGAGPVVDHAEGGLRTDHEVVDERHGGGRATAHPGDDQRVTREDYLLQRVKDDGLGNIGVYSGAHDDVCVRHECAT